MNGNNETLYAKIQKNRFSKGYSLIIKKCAYCKMEHIHSGEEGHRVAHCFDKKTGRGIAIEGYFVKVDWDQPKNQALREEYEAYYDQNKGMGR